MSINEKLKEMSQSLQAQQAALDEFTQHKLAALMALPDEPYCPNIGQCGGSGYVWHDMGGESECPFCKGVPSKQYQINTLLNGASDLQDKLSRRRSSLNLPYLQSILNDSLTIVVGETDEIRAKRQVEFKRRYAASWIHFFKQKDAYRIYKTLSRDLQSDGWKHASFWTKTYFRFKKLLSLRVKISFYEV